MKTRRTGSLQYIIFYKPFGVLSQFTPEKGHKTVKDFGPFPPDVYPVGRLDLDSEGLLLLTNDNALKHRATDPKFKHLKTYLAQVERIPGEQSLKKLREGVMIEGRKTKPAGVRLLKEEPDIPPRSVPIRFRKNVPTAWLEIMLHEGRNRQVRKMTAAVGHPTLRLIRIRFGALSTEGLQPGKHRSLEDEEIEAVKKSLKLS
jgi:23S rRNA pseudouridine2457 synthase